VRSVEGGSAVVTDDEDEDADRDAPPLPGGGVWLIQCKRERAIGPTKIAPYMDAMKPTLQEDVYGIIFAAACEIISCSPIPGFRF
jgi:hypothetical protein